MRNATTGMQTLGISRRTAELRQGIRNRRSGINEIAPDASIQHAVLHGDFATNLGQSDVIPLTAGDGSVIPLTIDHTRATPLVDSTWRRSDGSWKGFDDDIDDLGDAATNSHIMFELMTGGISSARNVKLAEKALADHIKPYQGLLPYWLRIRVEHPYEKLVVGNCEIIHTIRWDTGMSDKAKAEAADCLLRDRGNEGYRPVNAGEVWNGTAALDSLDRERHYIADLDFKLVVSNRKAELEKETGVDLSDEEWKHFEPDLLAEALGNVVAEYEGGESRSRVEGGRS